MLTSSLALILESAHELSEPIRVTGTTSSSKALLLAKYVHSISEKNEWKKPLVVLCATDEIAGELSKDLETLSFLSHSSDLRILHFPTWEQSPFSPIALSIRTRFARLNTLSAILGPDPPSVILTTIAASSQATLPPSLFQELSISLQVGTSHLSRETLISSLLRSGYLRVDPVEDTGTFAARGDILDFFPPSEETPFRIEFFGDTIERVRKFDSATQRTLKDLTPIQSLTIPPAREVLNIQATASVLRETLKEHSDHLGISRAIRDPILNSLSEGHYPERSDAWACFAYLNPATLWDYLPQSCEGIVWAGTAWNDELDCQSEWKQFKLEQQKLFKESKDQKIIAPAFEKIFLWNPHLEQQVLSSSRIFLDSLELVDLNSLTSKKSSLKTRHFTGIENHPDLSRGNRHSFEKVAPQIRLWLKQGFKIFVFASTQSQLDRIQHLLLKNDFPCHTESSSPTGSPSTLVLRLGILSQGFQWASEGLIVLNEDELLGVRSHSKQRNSSRFALRFESGSAAKNWSGLQSLSDLNLGDAIVHVSHGIGRYQGMIRLDLSGAPSDFLQIEYAQQDKLYLPVDRLNFIEKYRGIGDKVSLDRLGSLQFAKTKEKVKESVKKIAFDLLALYAQREIQEGVRFSPRDSDFQQFEASFAFEETPDQLKAIDSVLSDMESGKVMDRLICGDVGYGKTEIAIRAAFRAVSDGKQVAVLVPTTVLAQQHELSFQARLKDYPVLIESLSRFKSSQEQKKALKALAKGKLDIIIGTHRLLSQDVHFHDLGLVIVDEEHRFGVEHKERLKTLKTNTHVLTLTATPIPRTLHMALSGLRDMSLINTPPVDRLPIRTYVSQSDPQIVKKAIEFELSRGGQVFYVHNRIQSIYETAKKIQALVPSAQVGVGHGQMPEKNLEEVMLAFYQKKITVLVCTTIIESGLDLPSANTICIDHADRFGLAQLYQIRGRVGRGQSRAYAYLFLSEESVLTEEAKKRLEVIQRFIELGSGFHIASHDLEIRGGGDLLGPQQSGAINSVGFDLYTKLLEEAILDAKGTPLKADKNDLEPEIKTPFPAFLSETYVPEVHQRLSLYRRLSAASAEDEVSELEKELQDRFGFLPIEAQNLFWLIRLKFLLKKMGIQSLTVGKDKVSLLAGPKSPFDPIRMIALASANPDRYQLKPDSKLVIQLEITTLKDLLFELESRFEEFSDH